MGFRTSESEEVKLLSLLASLSEQSKSAALPLIFSRSLPITSYLITEMWVSLHTRVGQHGFTVRGMQNQVSTPIMVCAWSFCFGRFVAVYTHIFREALLLASEIREFPF